MEENRFLRCVREYREEKQKKLPYDPEDRFACLRADYVETDNRFERAYLEHKQERYEPRLQRQNYSEPEKHEPRLYRHSFSELERQPILPRKPRALTIEDQEQFPSLPSSPSSKASKTPKTPLITPLREEFDFIPLPKSASDFVSLPISKTPTQQPSESQQYYQVVRKFTGGSWSDRLKLSIEMQKEQEEEDVEGLEYDADGFPILKSVTDLVN
jgi:hypothetical protein